MITLHILDFFNLDGYKSLIDKYNDTNREKYKAIRHWAYNNYKQYFNRAWRERDFRLMIALRKAKHKADYIQLYNLMIDMDGDIDNQITVSR